MKTTSFLSSRSDPSSTSAQTCRERAKRARLRQVVGTSVFRYLLLVGSVTTVLAGCGTEDPIAQDGSSGGAPLDSTTGGTTTAGGSGSGGKISSGGATPTGGSALGSGGMQSSGGAETASGGADGTGGEATGTGGSADGTGGSESGTGGSTSSGTPSNCSDSLTPGDSNRSVPIDGMDRKFIMHVPSGYVGTDEVPLLIDFHPLGGTGSQEKQGSGFAALSDQEGFIVLWPDGIDNAWNVGPCCTNSRDIDDVAFARAMVADLESIACIDQKRIYASGFSMGGGMSHYLACHAADIFAAVAPSAFDLLEENVGDCVPSRPISVFAMRGTNDTVVPFNGGPGSSGRATFLGAQQTFEKWGELDGCTGEPTTSGDTQMYTTCAAGVEVGLMTIQGGGHAWGPSDVAWDFLQTKTLP